MCGIAGSINSSFSYQDVIKTLGHRGPDESGSYKEKNVVLIHTFKEYCAILFPKGVLLKDILSKAKLQQQNHKDRNFYVVARSSDGYKATFSWAELFNNPTGDHTYVIFEENNLPLTKKGAMMLNSNHDIKTGPRHVNWLKTIEVKRVD